MTIPVYEEFGGLPEFSLGPVRERPELNEQAAVFDGPWYQQEISEDRPTFWSCAVICNPRQSRAFQDFIEQVVGVNAGFFKKSIITENGKSQQLLRITSGIPQGRQIRNTAWRFDFVVMTARANFSGGDLPGDDELDRDLIPTLWRYIDMRAVFGLNPGAATCVDSSESGQLCYFGFDSGRAARTYFGGIGFKELPRYLGSGSTGAINDLKCSANGKVALAIFSTGHASITKDAGKTWAELPQFLNSGASAPHYPRAVAVSADGQKMVAVFDNGFASRSLNGGVSWAQMPQGLGTGATTVYLSSVCMSSDGSIIYAVGNDGRISKSTDSGASWMPLARNLGISYDGSNDIDRIRCSDTGTVLIASIGGQVATSSDGGVNWVKYNQAGGSLTVVEMSPRGQVGMASSPVVDAQYSRYTTGNEFGTSFIDIVPYTLTAEAAGAGTVKDLKSCKSMWFAAQVNGHAAYCDRSAPQPSDGPFGFKRGLNITSGLTPHTEAANQYEVTELAASREASYAYMIHCGRYYPGGEFNQITFMKSVDAGKTWASSDILEVNSQSTARFLCTSDNGQYVAVLISNSTVRVSDDYANSFWYVELNLLIESRNITGLCIDNDGYIAISLRPSIDTGNMVMVSNVPMGGAHAPGSTIIRTPNFTALPVSEHQMAISGGYLWRTQKLKAITQTTYVDVDPSDQVINNQITYSSTICESELYNYSAETSHTVGGYDNRGLIHPTTVLRSKPVETDGYDELTQVGTCVAAYNNFVFIAGCSTGVIPNRLNAIAVSDDYGDTFELINITDGEVLMPYAEDRCQYYGTQTQIKRIVTCKSPTGALVVLAIMFGGPNNLIRGVR